MDTTVVRNTYLSVVSDLSRSDFARRRDLIIAPQHYQLVEALEIAALLPPGGKFLDIGTGTGVIPETILRLGHSVTTVDVARNEKGREPLERLIALGAEGYFVVVGQEPIPIPDGSVDVVFAGDVIEHLPGTPRYFLAELLRVLRPGGHIVLTTPNAVRLTVRIRVALGYSNWPPVSIYLANPPNPAWHAGHHHEYVSEELKFILLDAGFSDPKTIFVEDNLRRSGIIQSFNDIKVQDRFSNYWEGRLTRRLNPLGFARLVLLGITQMIPTLRSTLLAIARKPEQPSAT